MNTHGPGPIPRSSRPCTFHPHRDVTRGPHVERHHLHSADRTRPRLALRDARRRPRRVVQGFRRHQLRRTARWPCTACSRSTPRGTVASSTSPGSTSCPTKGLNIPVEITLSDSGTWPMIASLALALLMAVGARARRPLPRVPTAAPRRAARQGGRVARPRALPAGRRAHQLRQLVPAAREHRPRRDDRELPRSRQALPRQQPLRRRVRAARWA